jgi:hypothetical protein
MARNKPPHPQYRLWSYLHRQGITIKQLIDLFKHSHFYLNKRLRTPRLFTLDELMIISCYSNRPIYKIISLAMSKANYEYWLTEQVRTSELIDSVSDVPLNIPKHKKVKVQYKYLNKTVYAFHDSKPSIE